MNGRIQRFIPKGCDIDSFTDKEIQAIEDRLNDTPRKCLNYRTPREIMMQQNLLTSPNPSGAIEG
jgi:IS30 family transposase